MDTMTPEPRRARLVPNNQTLLDEWAEANKLWTEANKLRIEANKLWAKGHKFWTEGRKLRIEGRKLWAEGDRLWEDAVANEFGPACVITWEDRDCILGCGERYSWYGVPDVTIN